MIIIIIPDVIRHLHDGVLLLLMTRILFVCPFICKLVSKIWRFWESLLAILRLCQTVLCGCFLGRSRVTKWRSRLPKQSCSAIRHNTDPASCATSKWLMERFQSRGQHQCHFIGTKNSFYIKNCSTHKGFFSTTNMAPFSLFGTLIWPPWRHIKCSIPNLHIPHNTPCLFPNLI